ncbi:hypothetical protein JTB14_017155 [Gonioctena quinquepunctata]|nr:hypothetical protein JTB14_017155 [Gonioctena quinquepunctata]
MSLEGCFESSAIEKDNTVCIIIIYRPPTGDLETFYKIFEFLLNNVTQKYTSIIKSGDLNIHSLQKTCPQYKKLLDLLDSYELSIITNEPTRSGNIVTTSGIDYIITNLKDYSNEVIDFGISDHTSQIFKWHQNNKKQLTNSSEREGCNIHGFQTKMQSLDLTDQTGNIEQIFSEYP